MKSKRRERKDTTAASASSVRASISFPPDLYSRLENLAKQKKVSMAWVVRDAAEKYAATVADQGKENL